MKTKQRTKTKTYRLTKAELCDLGNSTVRIEITPVHVFISGGGMESAVTHRIFRDMIKCYQSVRPVRIVQVKKGRKK